MIVIYNVNTDSVQKLLRKFAASASDADKLKQTLYEVEVRYA